MCAQYCFNLFDSLMMLVRGRVVYFGPISESCFRTDPAVLSH